MRAAVLGGGSWGTALAALLEGRGHAVSLWMRDPGKAEEVERTRENRGLLPGVRLASAIRVTSELPEALSGAELVVSAIPSSATRAVARAASPHVGPGAAWLSATKGFEHSTRRRMTEVAAAEVRGLGALAVLSGPSFAVEVAQGQPTAVVVASADLAAARALQALVSGPTFRAYASTDVVGVEVAGALKNVIGIAAGLLGGLGLGHDPLAALVTRGLHEMGLLVRALGGEATTVSGLAGLGDLVLTCTGGPSRNRRLGEMIAQGATLEAARAALGQVAEGVATTGTALVLASERGVDMPITSAVDDVLSRGVPAREAITRLMGRGLKDEGP